MEDGAVLQGSGKRTAGGQNCMHPAASAAPVGKMTSTSLPASVAATASACSGLKASWPQCCRMTCARPSSRVASTGAVGGGAAGACCGGGLARATGRARDATMAAKPGAFHGCPGERGIAIKAGNALFRQAALPNANHADTLDVQPSSAIAGGLEGLPCHHLSNRRRQLSSSARGLMPGCNY